MASVTISLKVSEEEKAAWSEAASGDSLSTWIKEACNLAIASSAPEGDGITKSTEGKIADVGGIVPTKKHIQHLDMSYLNDHRIRMEAYFKRLKAEGIVFDWSLCVKAGTDGHKSRCKQLHVPLCDACIGQNADMIKRKADLDAKIEAGRKAEMEAINAYRS